MQKMHWTCWIVYWFEQAILFIKTQFPENFQTTFPKVELIYSKYMPDYIESIQHILDIADLRYCLKELTDEEHKEIENEVHIPILNISQKPMYETLFNKHTILRYLGSITKFYPTKDPLHAALVDQWVDLHAEFITPLLIHQYPEKYGFKMSYWEKARHSTWLYDTHIPKYLTLVEKEVDDADWFASFDKPTIADFLWGPSLQTVSTGGYTLNCDRIKSIFEPYIAINQYLKDFQNYIDTELEIIQDTIDDTDNKEKKKE